ncbi:unnamed protein product [Lasius platythorax]|uniref:Uncharacterized protein n=1 Tax=Lasius platythorax TaxID=488582 RepID=A0AAV2NYD6_9HYME
MGFRIEVPIADSQFGHVPGRVVVAGPAKPRSGNLETGAEIARTRWRKKRYPSKPGMKRALIAQRETSGKEGTRLIAPIV